MADPLEVELAAMGRLSKDLSTLSAGLRLLADMPAAGATPDASVDMPSLVAARPVSNDTMPDLQGKVADRLMDMSLLVEQARKNFAEQDDAEARENMLVGAGTLLPSQ